MVIAPPSIADTATWDQVAIDELTTDHFASLTVLHLSLHPTPTPHAQPRWNLKKADWSRYTTALRNLSANSGTSPTSLQEDLQDINEGIFNAASKSIPLTRPHPRTICRKLLHPEAKTWTAHVSRATKAFKSHPTNQTLAELRATQHEARRQLYKLRTDHWHQWCSTLQHKSTSYIWKEVKKIKGQPPQPISANPAQKSEDIAR